MLSIATVLATFVAGLGSFLAPCTVPLLPAYLTCVSGVGAAELTDPDRHSFRLRLLAGSLLYVAGFTVVFVLLGLSAGGIARVANGAVSGRIVEIVGRHRDDPVRPRDHRRGADRYPRTERRIPAARAAAPSRCARGVPRRRRLRARLDAVRRPVPRRGADARGAQRPRRGGRTAPRRVLTRAGLSRSSPSRSSGRHSPTFPAGSRVSPAHSRLPAAWSPWRSASSSRPAPTRTSRHISRSSPRRAERPGAGFDQAGLRQTTTSSVTFRWMWRASLRYIRKSR